jgi:hypothetical protein
MRKRYAGFPRGLSSATLSVSPAERPEMDVYIIGNTDEKKEALEQLTGKSLADDVAFITEDEKTPGELLTEFIFEDFVRGR